MPPLIDLTNQKFGRLTVLKQIKDSKYTSWKCQCSCGNIIATVTTGSLKNSNTKSCGCLQKELAAKRLITHGMTKSPEFKIWANMKERCYNPNSKVFKNYGGRGITMCQEWKDNFIAFYKDMGNRPSPKLTIERINNNKGYFPKNCCWATYKKQASNKRNNRSITLYGWTLNLSAWARFVGKHPATILSRLYTKWPCAKAIFQPVRHHKPYIKKLNLL